MQRDLEDNNLKDISIIICLGRLTQRLLLPRGPFASRLLMYGNARHFPPWHFSDTDCFGVCPCKSTTKAALTSELQACIVASVFSGSPVGSRQFKDHVVTECNRKQTTRSVGFPAVVHLRPNGSSSHPAQPTCECPKYKVVVVFEQSHLVDVPLNRLSLKLKTFSRKLTN